jgi:hypothetical protein
VDDVQWSGPATLAALRALPRELGQHPVAGAAALTTDAVVRWDKGEIGEGLQRLRDAVRREGGISRDARHGQPLHALASALVDLRQLDQAEEILRAADSQPLDDTPARVAVCILRARIQLAAGELTRAAAASLA